MYSEYSKIENLDQKFKRKKRMQIYSEYSKIEITEEKFKRKI